MSTPVSTPHIQAAMYRELRAATRSERERFLGKVVNLRSLATQERLSVWGYNPLVSYDEGDSVFAWRDWKYASVTTDDIAVMADSKDAVRRLIQITQILSPLLHEFGLVGHFSHVYDLDNKNRGNYGAGITHTGFCCRHHPNGDPTRNISTYISVVTSVEAAAVIHSMIHELAHVLATVPSEHDREFRVRFGEYLGWYFSQETSPYREELAEFMRGTATNYFPPFFADDLVDENRYLYNLCDHENLYSRVSDAALMEVLEDRLRQKAS